jgi:hypothetical protein
MRAHRAGVDARLFGEPKRPPAVQADFPATDVGINKMSTRIDCVLPNPGRRDWR